MKCSMCNGEINLDYILVHATRMEVEYRLNLHWRCFRSIAGVEAERRVMDALIRHVWIQPELFTVRD